MVVYNQMDTAPKPKLRFLHSEDILNPAKLEVFGRLPTDAIKLAIYPGQPGSLKARPDGTVLDGHHRLRVLPERDENIHEL
jgi:hypothetical protein